jgi:hypothetical protein
VLLNTPARVVHVTILQTEHHIQTISITLQGMLSNTFKKEFKLNLDSNSASAQELRHSVGADTLPVAVGTRLEAMAA